MTNQDTTTDTTVHALVPHWLGIACDQELLASTVATDHSPIPEGETDCMGMRVITCPDCLALLRAANEAGVAIDDYVLILDNCEGIADSFDGLPVVEIVDQSGTLLCIVQGMEVPVAGQVLDIKDDSGNLVNPLLVSWRVLKCDAVGPCLFRAVVDDS